MLQAADLAPYIDHTLLKPEASEADILKLCDEAIRHRFKAVCVNPVHVRASVERLSGSSVLTACVVGFPLGASLAPVKALEAQNAIRDGAAEIDMVLRIDLARQARWTEVEADIASVVVAASANLLAAACALILSRFAERRGRDLALPFAGREGPAEGFEEIL
ncbi:MAG: deoxyribose-phosphate aldolase, partial [Bdellovibrionota bacterium]